MVRGDVVEVVVVIQRYVTLDRRDELVGIVHPRIVEHGAVEQGGAERLDIRSMGRDRGSRLGVAAGDRRIAVVRVHEEAAADIGVGVREVGLVEAAIGEADARAGVAAVVPAGDETAGPELELVARLPVHLTFEIVLVFDRAFGLAAGEVLEVAVVLVVVVAGDTHVEARRHLGRERAFDILRAEVADRGAELAVRVVGRPHGNHVDRAAGRLAAADVLRTALDLLLREEQRGLVEAVGRVDVELVLVVGDTLVVGDVHRLAADAADVGVHVRGVVREAGSEVGDVGDGVDADGVALGAGEHRHGDRNPLQARLTLFGGDHQLGHAGRGLVGRRGLGGRGGRRCLAYARNEAQRAASARQQQQILGHLASQAPAEIGRARNIISAGP